MTRTHGKHKTRKAREWWIVCYPECPDGAIAWSSRRIAAGYRTDLILEGAKKDPFVIVKVRAVVTK